MNRSIVIMGLCQGVFMHGVSRGCACIETVLYCNEFYN